MKKFGKFLASAVAVAGAIAGGLYVYNKYIVEKAEDDVEDIDDLEDVEETEAPREYVSINIASPEEKTEE